MSGIGVFEFSATLWRHQGTGGWHFLTLPGEVAEDVDELTAGLRHGFGSVRVGVTVGGSTWRTSVFPDRATGSYLLPVKKSVRSAEELVAGDELRARLELIDL